MLRAAVLGIVVAAAGAAPPAPPVGERAPAPAYPDPVRFEADIAAFEREDAEHPPAPDGFLCIGSSSIRFWHEHLAEDLSPLDPIPRGFGGSTMQDVLHFADRIVLPYRPRAILLYEGDNDLDFGISAGEFLETFRAFDALVQRNLLDTRIYVLSIKPCPSRWSRWPEMREANRRLEEMCAKEDRLTFVDVATPMLGEAGYPRPEIFLPDSLHLNRAGYGIWRDVVRETVLPRELGPGDAEPELEPEPERSAR